MLTPLNVNQFRSSKYRLWLLVPLLLGNQRAFKLVSYKRLGSCLSPGPFETKPNAKALAELINFQHRIPFSKHGGEGTRSSSDGLRFRAVAAANRPAQVKIK